MATNFYRQLCADPTYPETQCVPSYHPVRNKNVATSLCVFPNKAAIPEIEICIFTEQNCLNDCIYLKFLSDQWLQLYREFLKIKDIY